MCRYPLHVDRIFWGETQTRGVRIEGARSNRDTPLRSDGGKMKRIHRRTLSRLGSALGRLKAPSGASAPTKLNYADPPLYSLPCSQSASPLYRQKTRDDHMSLIVLAFAAVTAIAASTGDETWMKVRPHAEPELYARNDRRFDEVYDLAEQAPPLGSGEST